MIFLSTYWGAENSFYTEHSAEIIPIEFRMEFQPDPDNAGGGRYVKVFSF